MLDLKNLNSKDLKLVQQGLKEAGLYRMRVDGIYGPGTQGAYDNYWGKVQYEPAPVIKEMTPPVEYDGDLVKVGGLTLSKKGVDEIIYSEVGGEAYYNKYLQKPTLPPGYSTITFGFGLDARYYSPGEIKMMLDACCHSLSQAAKQQLINCGGISRSKSQSILSSLSWIRIPFNESKCMFEKFTLPDYAKKTLKTYPGLDKLHPNAQAAMVSLIFNRGENISPSSSRRREMFNIKNHIKNKDYQSIANELYSMKRLWPNIRGLRLRRDREAKLVLDH